MTIEPTEAADALAADAPVRSDDPTFAELGVRPETVAALAAAGIERAFAIQQYAVPIGMRGWSRAVFRRRRDRAIHVFSLDSLVAHLDEWER